jgi:cytidine deaminase
MEDDELIGTARHNVKPIALSRPDLGAATVGCALLARNGRIYQGICVHLSCGLGFCAEAVAMANMLRDGETQIATSVAVSGDGILSPCGRCREMMAQIDEANFTARILMPGGGSTTLSALLPEHWMKFRDQS